MGDYGWINYPYTFSEGKLLITFPDGTKILFTKVTAGVSNPTTTINQPSGGGQT